MAADMAEDVAALVKDVTPSLISALRAYGGSVLAKINDDGADETVSLGRRLLQKVFGHKKDGEPLPTVLAEVIDNPDDEDYLGTLRTAIRKALQGDAQLLAEVREILKEARPPVTAGPQTAAADHGGIAQTNVAGGDVFAPIVRAGRDANVTSGDQTVYRTPD
jgi:hypothetical protein